MKATNIISDEKEKEMDREIAAMLKEGITKSTRDGYDGRNVLFMIWLFDSGESYQELLQPGVLEKMRAGHAKDKARTNENGSPCKKRDYIRTACFEAINAIDPEIPLTLPVKLESLGFQIFSRYLSTFKKRVKKLTLHPDENVDVLVETGDDKLIRLSSSSYNAACSALSHLFQECRIDKMASETTKALWTKIASYKKGTRRTSAKEKKELGLSQVEGKKDVEAGSHQDRGANCGELTATVEGMRVEVNTLSNQYGAMKAEMIILANQCSAMKALLEQSCAQMSRMHGEMCAMRKEMREAGYTASDGRDDPQTMRIGMQNAEYAAASRDGPQTEAVEAGSRPTSATKEPGKTDIPLPRKREEGTIAVGRGEGTAPKPAGGGSATRPGSDGLRAFVSMNATSQDSSADAKGGPTPAPSPSGERDKRRRVEGRRGVLPPGFTYHHGALNPLPSDWKFDPLTLPQLILCWLIGDPERNIPPFALLDSRYVKHLKGGSILLSRMRLVMTVVEAEARKKGVWAEEMRMEDWDREGVVQMWDGIEEDFRAKYCQTRMKKNDLRWVSVYHKMNKMHVFDNGGPGRRDIKGEKKRRMIMKELFSPSIGIAENGDLPSGAGSAARPTYHHGALNPLPSEWKFGPMTLPQLISHWLIGDPERSIPPLALLDSCHVKHLKGGQDILSKMRHVMTVVEVEARRKGFWAERMRWEDWDVDGVAQMWNGIEDGFRAKYCQTRMKKDDLSWWTVYAKMNKMRVFDNEGTGRTYIRGEKKRRLITKESFSPCIGAAGNGDLSDGAGSATRPGSDVLRDVWF